MNGQLATFVKHVEADPSKKGDYFIDYLYDTISKKNHNVSQKVNKLFSKFYHTITSDLHSSEMQIFLRVMTYTDYGKHDMIGTYIRVRTLIFQGFHKKIDNESELNKFQVNKILINGIDLKTH